MRYMANWHTRRLLGHLHDGLDPRDPAVVAANAELPRRSADAPIFPSDLPERSSERIAGERHLDVTERSDR